MKQPLPIIRADDDAFALADLLSHATFGLPQPALWRPFPAKDILSFLRRFASRPRTRYPIRLRV
jgi:hypothetical protein